MKRPLSLWLLALALVARGAVLPAAEVPTVRRPNILWLVSEDNGRFLGCYGDPLAKTPTLDKLAREGVLFERCFTMPVCAPARFTLISGMYPVTCGPAQHMRAQGKIPAWLKGFPAYLRSAGYYTSNNAKTDYNAPIRIDEVWDESSRQAHWRNRQPGRPFFSVFNHEVTHESCLFPEKELPLDFPSTDPGDVRIPPYQPDTPEMRADWARYYNHIRLVDGQIAAKLQELADAGLAEDTIVFYYADNGGVLPRSKRFLHESGTHVPLIVYFPPKWRHLAPAAPGTRIKQPVHFIDFAPTVLSLAGVDVPDSMQGRAFAGPARGEPNEFVFCARDRMDERYDMVRSVVDSRWLYIHNYRPDLPYMQRVLYQFRARGYQSWARVAAEGKLAPATAQFWGEKPTEELYDTATDPDNIHNLAASPAHQAMLERLRAALKRQVLLTYDNGFLPEGSALEGYEASRAPGAWPVERVFDLAGLASERDVANLPKLIDALDDSSEPIRWWAAQGCTMLGEQAATAEAALRRRLEDDSGAVAIAAAEALAALGKPEPALPVLEHWLQQDANPAFALQAANVLGRLGERARGSLPAMKAAAASIVARKNGTYPQLHDLLKYTIDVLEGRTPETVYPKATKPMRGRDMSWLRPINRQPRWRRSFSTNAACSGWARRSMLELPGAQVFRVLFILSALASDVTPPISLRS
jgi:arylsulfatase A-like enzyme